jgi:hypothetical protein
MNHRHLRWVGLLSLMALLQGCASYEGVPNPAWFPRAAAIDEGSRTPGRVALWVQPQVQATVSVIERVLRLQVGSIAERAVLATLGEGLQGGVQQVYAAPQAAGYSATVVIDAARFEHHERTLWSFWVPPLSSVSRYEATVALAFDSSLFDAQGRLVWRRTYDDDAGRLVWTTPSASSAPLPEDIGRVTHEAAWRLAQQVLRDVREWMDGERMRPREL